MIRLRRSLTCGNRAPTGSRGASAGQSPESHRPPSSAVPAHSQGLDRSPRSRRGNERSMIDGEMRTYRIVSLCSTVRELPMLRHRQRFRWPKTHRGRVRAPGEGAAIRPRPLRDRERRQRSAPIARGPSAMAQGRCPSRDPPRTAHPGSDRTPMHAAPPRRGRSRRRASMANRSRWGAAEAEYLGRGTAGGWSIRPRGPSQGRTPRLTSRARRSCCSPSRAPFRWAAASRCESR